MRRSVFLCALLGMLQWAAYGQTPPAAAPTAATNSITATNATAAAGRIQFNETIANLGKIRAGEVATHTFYFTNIGTAPLTISHVQPSCGCTAASDWTRSVEPGGTGTIPVSFNSSSFSGPISKTIEVTCSDPAQPRVTLQIRGDVWRPVDVSPQFAVINIPPESTSGSVNVRIINNSGEKLEFQKPETDSPSFEAKILPGTTNNENILQIATKGRLPAGNIQTRVTVKTTSTNAPLITVTAWANVQPHFVVIPGQMTLPAPPLTGPISPSILIQNNSTKPMSVTKAKVNADDVKVEVKEMNPGRQFAIYVTFPAGFEIPPGQQLFLTADSGVAESPEIRVPIAQMPRPAAPRQTALTPDGGRQGLVTPPQKLPTAPGS